MENLGKIFYFMYLHINLGSLVDPSPTLNSQI